MIKSTGICHFCSMFPFYTPFMGFKMETMARNELSECNQFITYVESKQISKFILSIVMPQPMKSILMLYLFYILYSTCQGFWNITYSEMQILSSTYALHGHWQNPLQYFLPHNYMQASKFCGNNHFGYVEVSCTSNLWNRFIGSDKIFCC